jgi:opacity protein-like surface antigen
MKNTFRIGSLVTCCLGLVALSEVARSQGIYFNANAGAAFAEDVDVHRFVSPTPNRKFELNTGGRLSVAGGYNFNEFLGAQLETGFIYNEVKGSHGDAVLSHVPMLASIVLRCDKTDCKFVPYLGAGAGGDVSIISLDRVREPGGGVVDGSAGDVVFAWQAFAGLRYKFTDKMSIGGGYKFYSAEGATWDIRHTSGDIKTGTAHIHSVVVDFTIQF